MEKDEYKEFRKRAENALQCRSDMERLEREFALFSDRCWEKYAVALSRIISSVRRNLLNTVIDGTVTGLIAYDGIEDDRVFEWPLNASFSVVWPFGEMVEKDLGKLMRIINRNLRGLELYSEKSVLSEDFKGKKILIAISKEPLDKSSFDKIAEEIRNGRDNSPLMMEYLVLIVDAHLGLSVDLKSFI